MNNAYVESTSLFDINPALTGFSHQRVKETKNKEKKSYWKLVITASTYILSVILLHPYLGDGVSVLALIPVSYMAWTYGQKGGLVASMGAIVLNPIICSQALGHYWLADPLWMVFSNGLIIYNALLIGHLGEMNTRVRTKLDAKLILENQMRANEEKLKTVFSSVPSGIVLVDKKDMKIRYANQYAIGLMGNDRSDIIGSHCRKFICVDKDGGCPIISEGGDDEYECDLRGVNGALPIMKKVVPVTINEQEFLLESFIDISDRKAMENSLRAEKDITKKFMDTAGVIMLVLNNKGNTIFINQKGCEVLDRSEEELLGKNWVEEFLPADDIENGRAIFDELINGGSDIFNYYELGYLTKSGEERTIAWHHSVLMNDEGMVTHIISSGEDITLRKANEKALKTSEEKYRLIFDTAASMIISIDMNGTIVDCNKKLKNTLGYGRSELSGENITRLVHPDDISMAMESIEEVFSHGTSMNKECRMVTKSGKIIDVSVNSSGIKEDGEEYSRMICMMEDITEKKKSENELLEKTGELERFAKMAIGRENKMIELKARVKHLEGQVSGLIEISLG